MSEGFIVTGVNSVGKFEAFDRLGNTLEEQEFEPGDVAQVEDAICGFTDVVFNLGT